MLRRALHELEVELWLTAVSPLLIKDGRLNQESREQWESDKEKRKKMPAAIPISRNSDDEVRLAVCDREPLERAGKLDFYLPGSSLKGAWRSHLERTIRGLTPESDAKICDPLDADNVDVDKNQTGLCSACSAVLEQKKKRYSKEKTWFPAYAMSCPICRMFGNTVLASRLKISDGVRIANGRLVQRESVAINRKNGQVSGAPFKFFALQETRFRVTLTVRNYELYQLLLLGVLLSDIAGMRVPLGSGKSKGYGQVRGEIQPPLKLTTFSLQEPSQALAGLGDHPAFGEELCSAYRARASGTPPALPRKWERDSVAPWRWQCQLKVAEFFALLPSIKLNLGLMPNLSQRLEWNPGQEPAWPA
jgi:CRISPR/Cas system CSM-associated protein Csm3 (group 7 of RAMP superfamily)